MDAVTTPGNLSDDSARLSPVHATMNFTNVTMKIPQVPPVEFRIVATVIHVIIFVVGFFGNIAVVIVVRKTKSMHTPTYCYLVRAVPAPLRLWGVGKTQPLLIRIYPRM